METRARNLGRGLSALLNESYISAKQSEIERAIDKYPNTNNLRPIIVRCFELEEKYNSLKYENHGLKLPLGFGVTILLYEELSIDYYKYKINWYLEMINKIEDSLFFLKLKENKEKLEREKLAKETLKNIEIIKHKPYIQKPQKTYLIKDNNTGYYKIGKSVDPKTREKTLQAEKPTYTTVKVWNKNIETELHRKYKKYRKRGEWFELNKIQVKYICTHY